MSRSVLWDSLKPFRGSAEQELRERLRDCPVFQDLPDRALAVVRSLCHIRQYKANEHIFRRGEPGVGMYIVLEGDVEIYRHEGEYRRTFANLSRGDFFGELALLEDAPRTASARSVGYSRLLGFFRPDLLSLAARKPRLGGIIILNMARLTARRLINTNRELEEMEARSAGLRGRTPESAEVLDEISGDASLAYAGGRDPD
jgi:CRP/FNR family transcriptional regulator, cyclic AMP receptor protein